MEREKLKEMVGSIIDNAPRRVLDRMEIKIDGDEVFAQVLAETFDYRVEAYRPVEGVGAAWGAGLVELLADKWMLLESHTVGDLIMFVLRKPKEIKDVFTEMEI